MTTSTADGQLRRRWWISTAAGRDDTAAPLLTVEVAMDFDTPPKSSSLNVIPASDHSDLVTMVAVLVDDSRTS
ncbi:hypothetical protein HanXRQr2_Chr17g0795591 [Helianthus annuus]|uniref:Uncharacterized protein n=1 Tax=Helianthus annuus TaxID=4232 RepID=A0A9K3DIC7_HELAN|nr:hypothetical protein HanXRQr2_Chr17g0795591 [Helianthus annuus]KAJ0812572.1 hypothetical protein HanPSC8_Chr17g0763481 [Helianthus annuus]KAJ0862791.1 hypothetical protein HanPSC8_Chr12g0522401 [Helianthus annuus]